MKRTPFCDYLFPVFSLNAKVERPVFVESYAFQFSFHNSLILQFLIKSKRADIHQPSFGFIWLTMSAGS